MLVGLVLVGEHDVEESRFDLAMISFGKWNDATGISSEPSAAGADPLLQADEAFALWTPLRFDNEELVRTGNVFVTQCGNHDLGVTVGLIDFEDEALWLGNAYAALA